MKVFDYGSYYYCDLDRFKVNLE